MFILLLVFSHALSCPSHVYVWLSLVLYHILQSVSSLVAQLHSYLKCYASFCFMLFLHLFCALKDFGGVRIPFLCTLYSNAIILNSAQILGSPSIFFRTIICSNHNIFCSIGLTDLFDCLLLFRRSLKVL